MARLPKPFFHRGCCVTDVGGKRTKLAQGRENKELAKRALHELLAKQGSERPTTTGNQLAVWELCECRRSRDAG